MLIEIELSTIKRVGIYDLERIAAAVERLAQQNDIRRESGLFCFPQRYPELISQLREIDPLLATVSDDKLRHALPRYVKESEAPLASLDRRSNAHAKRSGKNRSARSAGAGERGRFWPVGMTSADFGVAVEHVAAGRGNFAKLSTSSNTVDLPADLI